jgi:cation-transporting ATPase 13A2
MPVYALVTRTGYATTKGGLVRDILFPKPIKFKFYRDAMMFVGIMALVAVIGFLIIIPRLIELNIKTNKMID